VNKFEIPPLPYRKDALAPFISAETIELHYEKHHKGYLKKLNDLVKGKPEADQSLEDLIRTAKGDLFNNAAQVWNHNFYWLSLAPNRGGKPTGEIAKRIDASFGSYANFRREFAAAANGEFGSGWAWLVLGMGGDLLVCNSNDAENPVQRNLVPLLTLDVWEHAYYVDYRNERARYVESFLDHLLHWEFVATNLTLAPPANDEREMHGEGDAEADARYRERATAFARSRKR
jgi:superoxide dismutase, Fe-Mn family